MRGAAGTIKRVTLELGGKSANVVFADADLERAAAAAPYAVFDNAGQDCCARSRILVERSAYDRFVELLVDATRGVKVGDPALRRDRDGAADLGRAPRDGRLVRRGRAALPRRRARRPGFWFPCTLVEASNDDRIAREEVFGPVAAVIPFDDEADAIRHRERHAVRPLGLDLDPRRRPRDPRRPSARDRRPLDELEQLGPGATPFGGFKQSGFGRELGMAAMDGYSELKNVFFSSA